MTRSEAKQVVFINRMGLSALFALGFGWFWQIESVLDQLLLGFVGSFVVTTAFRMIFTRFHLMGIAFIQEQEFEKAIEQFTKSYSFFDRFSFVDSWRSLFFFSASPLSYREKALFHMGYCYSQLGKPKECIQTYEKVLKEFPNSPFAKETVTRLIEALKAGHVGIKIPVTPFE